MNYRLFARIALAYLTLQNLQIGLWALFAPQSFYDGFPAPGRGWISVDGPYNEHLIRDVGALNLALGLVFALAAFSLATNLMKAAAAGALVWGVPHFIYHAFNSGDLPTGDAVASLGGLAFFAVLPIFILWLAGRMPEPAEQLSPATA